jgi:transposase
MYKYIQDSIKNNSRFVLNGLSRPQQKALSEIVRGLFTAGEPIRLIHSLKYSYSKNQIVNMYLQRWGVENIFKRVKEKFGLESIRVLKWQKFVNLVALIQLAVLVSTTTFKNDGVVEITLSKPLLST